MPPGGKRKRGQSGGPVSTKHNLKRNPKPKAQATIVRPEIRRNNARRAFPGSSHRGFVSCDGECWHEITETASTVHDAFLTLNVPNIVRLNLPKPESFAAAHVRQNTGVGQNRNPWIGSQPPRIDNKGRKLSFSVLPETAHCGFLTLRFPRYTQRPSPPLAASKFHISAESEDFSRHRDDRFLYKHVRSEQISRPTERPEPQFIGNLLPAQATSLHSVYSRSRSTPFLVPTKRRDEDPTLAGTPVTPAFSLITPTALFDANTLDISEFRLHPHIDNLIRPASMAPVRDPVSVQQSMKDVIQILYDMQSQVHGFVPETQSHLIDKVSELATSLSHLQTLTSKEKSPNNPIHDIRIAPEFIDYVDDGRNPDIYTRDFVELVQRGNSVINGKQKAFRDFSEVYAKALKEGFNGIGKEVDEVMANAGSDEGSSSIQNDCQNGN